MKKNILLAAMVSVAAFVSANDLVVAADEVTFQAIDLDVNGEISLAEASANEALIEAFAELDADQSGTLTEEEFSLFTLASE
ncbi:hypothetical protein [Reinekea marinisedimentorum]|uniref:EF hand domain-containing protein n=1 Tax=Reinekea marinisedimentorum TaxID=230495 RepID=A0A4R3I7A5_9GAMM|nr:hypothetical protein [Reinekea marinisedimentorum]TCS41150.1 EF hand domain-containing protein [Reinekea marinisedimentorum]